MAYREFRNEATYAAPEFEGMPRTLAALDTANRIKAQQQNQRSSAYDNAKVASVKGGFPQHQKELDALVMTAKMGLNEWYKAGRKGKPIEVEDIMLHAENSANRSNLLYKIAEDKKKQIKERELSDPYYDGAYDNQEFDQKVFNPELSLANLDEMEKSITQFQPGQDKLNSFRVYKYFDDKVNEFAEKSTEEKNTPLGGAKKMNSYSGIFFDGDKPGVSKDVVKDVTNDRRGKEYFIQKNIRDVSEDLKKMKAAGLSEIPETPEGNVLRSLIESGDERGATMTLLENPGLNTVDSRTVYERNRDFVVSELKKREKVKIQNETDLSNSTPNADKGVTSKKYNFAPAYDQNAYGGAGGTFVNNQSGINGISIPVKGRVFNKGTGKLSGSPSSEREMFATTFNYLPVDKNGIPLNIQGETVEDQVRAIQNMTPEQIEKYDLKTVVQGQAWNKLDLSRARIDAEKLRSKFNRTEAEEAQLNGIEKTLENYDMDPNLAPELIQKELGIVVDDVIKVVDPGDVTEGQIRGKLGDFKLTNKKNETPEMKMIREAFESRKKEVMPVIEQKRQKRDQEFQSMMNEGRLTEEQPKPDVKSAKQKDTKGMIIMILPDGRSGEIPESALDQFLKDNPGAKKQ